MSNSPPPTDGPGRARECLDEFLARGLPALLRRMRSWKGLHPTLHGDVVEDLRQDLWVDCLENGDTIESLDREARHARWFRLLEHRHYQLRVRGRSRADPVVRLDDVEHRADRQTARRAEDAAPEAALAGRLLDRAAHLKNGRINLHATSRRLGIPPRAIRGGWSELAEELGYGAEFLAFWRQRLVEALVGLAADVLRDRGLLRVHDEAARRRPDPRARLQRIRRIKQQLSVRPLPHELRRVLAMWSIVNAGAVDPARALDAAAQLAPGDAAVLLWQFEHAVAVGDLGAATRALWDSRSAGADPVRVVLARARLLEASGRVRRAGLLLIRASVRHRDDPRLRAALASVREATGGRLPDADEPAVE